MLAASGRIGISSNDELLLAMSLQLDPGAATLPRFVKRILFLADESFQTQFSRLFEKRLPIAFQNFRDSKDSRRSSNQFPDSCLTVFQRNGPQIHPLMLRHIENVIEQWRRLISRVPVLKQLKR